MQSTTDPAACEGIWATSYENGYVRGGNDKCKIAYDYIDVAEPEVIQFCTQVMGLPAPATSQPITTLAPLPPPGPELPSGRILVGQDGQYPGTVSCSEYASEGIFSRYGAYGGQYSSTSIWNKYGTYGGRYGTYSAFSKYGGSPPEIIESGSFVTYLTVGYNAPSIHPADLVNSCFDQGTSAWE